MIVFRSQVRRESCRRRLRDLIDIVERWPAAATHDDVTAMLIELGELECGVADARQAERDDLTDVTQQWRLATCCGADVLWDRRPDDRRDAQAPAREHVRRQRTGARRSDRDRDPRDAPSSSIAALLACLRGLEDLPLPQMVERPVSEGFAYYGLSPEMYMEATERFLLERSTRSAQAPREAIVIGIRSIGTTLSAVVAAGLRRHGIEVSSVTVRPRGHPFERQLRCGHRLLDHWRRAADAEFLIVDEGPGLSGSSFVSVARLLTQSGVPLDRIVLMPSWDPEPGRLRSHEARTWWPRLRKVAASFERTIDPRQLLARPPSQIVDVGGGAWRAQVYASPAAYPAVHPQHERRKYLADEIHLLKWAGLGAYGQEHRCRAEALAEHRWGLPTLGLTRGFIGMPFLRGRPLTAADADAALVERLARYLAWRALEGRTSHDVDAAPLIDMIRVNVAESLGGGAITERVDLDRLADAARARAAIRLDARMFPHEWLRPPDARAGCAVKTDAVEHGDDHFFPGPTDAAWDLAATMVEFHLDASQRDLLLGSYVHLTGDPHVCDRLPFFELAYLAYRVGYTSMAVHALDQSADGVRFAAARTRYISLLRTAWQHAIRHA